MWEYFHNTNWLYATYAMTLPLEMPCKLFPVDMGPTLNSHDRGKIK